MKYLIFLCVLVIFSFNLSEQIAQFVNCSTPDIINFQEPDVSCVRVTCTFYHSYTVLGCSEYRCRRGKQIGYKEVDHDKVYPDCCGGPVCAD